MSEAFPNETDKEFQQRINKLYPGILGVPEGNILGIVNAELEDELGQAAQPVKAVVRDPKQ
jgi:hypothetical protein